MSGQAGSYSTRISKAANGSDRKASRISLRDDGDAPFFKTSRTDHLGARQIPARPVTRGQQAVEPARRQRQRLHRGLPSPGASMQPGYHSNARK